MDLNGGGDDLTGERLSPGWRYLPAAHHSPSCVFVLVVTSCAILLGRPAGDPPLPLIRTAPPAGRPVGPRPAAARPAGPRSSPAASSGRAGGRSRDGSGPAR